jgi:hypothetical protein
VAQTIDLRAEPLEHRVHSGAQSLFVVEIAGIGELQPQGTDALDAFVVDLPRPARALALAGLHPVAKPLDLDRALGGEPLRDARRKGLQCLPVGTAKAASAAQGDDQSAALALHAQRLHQRRTGLEAEFVQPGRLLPAGAIERECVAGEVDVAECASLHRGDAQARRGGAARGGHAQLATLLDHDEQRAGVKQCEAAIGHQAQQPQL